MKKNYAVFDIESIQWIKFLLLGHYDGTEYKEFRSIKRYINFLFNNPDNHNLHLYAHNGGRFDFNFFFQWFMSEEYEIKFIDRKSRILSLVVTSKKTNVRIQFIDSLALLPLSLEKLCNTFNVSHLKGTIDFKRLKKITPKLQKYLKSDCEALYNVIGEYDILMNEIYSEQGKTYQRKLTEASQAWHYFQSMNDNQLTQLNEFIEDEFRKNHYSGGRVEVFKGYAENLYYYDINSLYPYAMTMPMPCGNYYYANKIEKKKIGFYKVKVLNNLYFDIPPFLIKTKKSDMGNYYCNAEKNDIVNLSSIEIELLSDLGYQFKFIDGIYFNEKETLFYDFVYSLYERRKKTDDKGMQWILKRLMNSLYGKLGTSRKRKEMVISDNVNMDFLNVELGIVLIDKRINAKFILPYLASYITSFGRMELFKYLIECNPFYCDTDSIVTKKKYPVSNQIGKLKLEAKLKKAVFALPKTYAYIDDAGTETSVIKGYSEKVSFNDLYSLTKIQGTLTETRENVLSFRQAISRKKDIKLKINQYLQLVETTKKMPLKYEKRKQIKDKKTIFKTFPYSIRELAEMELI